MIGNSPVYKSQVLFHYHEKSHPKKENALKFLLKNIKSLTECVVTLFETVTKFNFKQNIKKDAKTALNTSVDHITYETLHSAISTLIIHTSLNLLNYLCYMGTAF